MNHFRLKKHHWGRSFPLLYVLLALAKCLALISEWHWSSNPTKDFTGLVTWVKQKPHQNHRAWNINRSKTSLLQVVKMFALHASMQFTAVYSASLQRHSLWTFDTHHCCLDVLKYGMNISNLNNIKNVNKGYKAQKEASKQDNLFFSS